MNMKMPSGLDLVKRKTELLRTFSTPDQVGELDFTEFLEKMLFRAYILYRYPDMDDFTKTVLNSPKSFSGIKGRTWQEITIKKAVGERAIMAELGDIEPMSLNEWRYLFTCITEDQLLGTTYYYVRFDDGVVRFIKVNGSQGDGGGPYSHSIEVGKISRSDSLFGGNPRIIIPTPAEKP